MHRVTVVCQFVCLFVECKQRCRIDFDYVGGTVDLWRLPAGIHNPIGWLTSNTNVHTYIHPSYTLYQSEAPPRYEDVIQHGSTELDTILDDQYHGSIHIHGTIISPLPSYQSVNQ